MTAPLKMQLALFEKCPNCKHRRKFERIYTPVAIRFGGPNAVNGWGTHTLDYPNPKSDLITGRAQELARNIKPAVVS